MKIIYAFTEKEKKSTKSACGRLCEWWNCDDLAFVMMTMTTTTTPPSMFFLFSSCKTHFFFTLYRFVFRYCSHVCVKVFQIFSDSRLISNNGAHVHGNTLTETCFCIHFVRCVVVVSFPFRISFLIFFFFFFCFTSSFLIPVYARV